MLFLVACATTVPDPQSPPAADSAPDTGSAPDSGLTDRDGDGYSGAEDCDDTDPAVNPSATEICGNGVDDDCDGPRDGESDGCPFSGVLRAEQGPLDWTGWYLADTRPHPHPRTGVPALLSDDMENVGWLDLGHALAGVRTVLDSVPDPPGGVADLEHVFDLADIAGDGETDWAESYITGVTPPEGGMRFSGVPTEVADGEAALVIESAWILGTTPDVDGDGIDDLLVAWDWLDPVLGWVPSTTAGVVAPETVAVASARMSAAEEMYRYRYMPGPSQRIDADGDGDDELVLTIVGIEGDYVLWWETGAVLLLDGPVSGGVVEAAAAASIQGDADLPDEPYSAALGITDAPAVADLDGDGHDDLVVPYADTTSETVFAGIFLGPFAETRGSADTLARIDHAYSDLHVGDVDGDGHLELFARTICPWDESTGAGAVYADPTHGGDASTTVVTVCDEPYMDGGGGVGDFFDIDGDGLADLIGGWTWLAR